MGIVNEMGHFDAGVPIKNTKACPDMNGRPPFNTIPQSAHLRRGFDRLQDVRSLRSLCALHNLKLDILSLFQCLKSFPLQRGIMYEKIIPALKANESKPLPIVEPFNCTFCLHKTLLSSRATTSYVASLGTRLATYPMKRIRQKEEQVGMTGSLDR
jgi:hypothetical protein